ncbi:hypothetical protein M404DRAFT_1002540 [Pisolithus tinctorius Marx 270]|uniref:Uncharacterized protein n=1 Tax=Pisolithus tinctorius Marx 270 TaxID=870435 RepID=A0A0C3IZ88_PISTI|nr:hypothetical protein M404DRAFT_1002540 [Pisolithus tinctorius Marx 270]
MSYFINTSANTSSVPSNQVVPQAYIHFSSILISSPANSDVPSHHPNIVSTNMKKYDRCTNQNEAAGWWALCYRHILQLHYPRPGMKYYHDCILQANICK